jgi:hypothetical protein
MNAFRLEKQESASTKTLWRFGDVLHEVLQRYGLDDSKAAEDTVVGLGRDLGPFPSAGLVATANSAY